MKNFRLSLIALIAMGNLGYAGGDIRPVTEYEIEDAIVAEVEAEEEEVYEEVYEEVVEPEPVVVKPKVVTPVAPPPVVTPPKKIFANGFYAGLGITGVRYENNCNCKKGVRREHKDTTYGGVVRVGYDFNKYIGVEARGSRTNWDSDGSKVKHAGLYIKPMVPVSDSANLYGLIGAAKTKVTGRMPNVDSESLALGAGVEIDLSKDTPKNGKYSRNFDGQGDQEKGLGLFVDYERMIVKDGAPDLDAVSAGVTYDF